MIRTLFWATPLLGLAYLLLPSQAGDAQPGITGTLEWAVPNPNWQLPFEKDAPIHFVNRTKSPAEWDKLPEFWNETTETVKNPSTGKDVTRRAVVIKVPLGLTQNPPVPVENPMTVAKWKLGKQLYFDGILCSDGTVSCATCHDPAKGYTDQLPVSTGISNLKGGVSAPTVINSAYNTQQFWDGRAASLEDQAQGPPQNPVEMFDGKGHAWNKVVERLQAKPEYVKAFQEAFGTVPTRDAAAKAIAVYERTVLSGNSLHDRAEVAMRLRAEEEETGKFEFSVKDYEKVLKEAFAKKDRNALSALGLDVEKDQDRIADVAKSLNKGRILFHGKARCNTCHVGENWTDNTYHNLGVGAKDGLLSASSLGRFGALPTGHKNPAFIGAFKTPTLRALLSTAPYMHDGSEKTLDAVVELYDKGGHLNEFLDPKMRDVEAEAAVEAALREGKEPPAGVRLYGPARKPIIPLRLFMDANERKDLVLFLKALQGDPIPAIVANPELMPK